ncbi:MAG: nitrogen fixation negative regulator NifL [Betaproteobacteria bacterium]|nr:nitrogen fixation negative regulator NifL [Betaproteobacteria bacterium]
MNKPTVPDDANLPAPGIADPAAVVPPQVFRLVVEQAALAISITDAHANILYANPTFERVTGYSRAEVIGHNESILSYRVTPKIVYETLWAQLKRQRPWNGLLVNRRKDGSRYLADLTITPVLDADGQTTHYLGMHRDVTEMHRLERQVQNHKALIESVVDAAQVAIVLLDENEHVLLDNQEYKKLIGDLGKEPAATLMAALRTQIGPGFDNARASRRGLSNREVLIEQPHRPPRWFSCSISWFEEQDVSADAFYEPARRHYLLLTIQDISELKRQQEAIRINALHALLAEQERIQGLREALAGAVYQLEGPLNMLEAAVKMLERRKESPGDDPLATVLDDAVRNGRETLETLRASIPYDAGELVQLVDLNTVLHDLLKLSTPALLAAGVVVDWQPAAKLPAIQGRATQLSTLFKQLLDNAVEALYESRSGQREMRVSTLDCSDHVEIVIEDSGPGIPEEWRYKVFEPFFTTKGADQHHLGMGLAIAQEIVARHGGTLDIDASYQPGCRMRVQLPCPRGEPS